MIKVSIYEDNIGLREVLTSVIREDKEFVLAGEFGHCLDVIQNTKVYEPDVIIMDIDMPGKSGIEGVKEVKKHFPQVEVIMNTVFDDDDRIFEAIKNGATGYLLKNNSITNLKEAILQVKNGGAPMSPTIARKLINLQQTNTRKENQDFKLSEREFQVLKLLSKGMSYKMIAEELILSMDTVRSHIKKSYEKLHVHSVTEAIHKVFIEKSK